MRGVLRWTIAGFAAGLTLAPVSVLAQEAPVTTNAPAADTVGPRELQNFSLQGNVTRPADQPATVPVRTTVAREQQPAASPPVRREQTTRRTADVSKPAPRPAAAAPRQISETTPEPQPIAPSASLTTAPAPTPASSPPFAPADAPTDMPAPEQHFALLPWLLAALALGAGGAFLLWRNRSRPAFAGGPEMDYFSAPEAAPTPPIPPPPPARAPAPPRASLGIVSTSLRPWIDIIAQPLRCIVTEKDVTIEFELELFNSGNAPARDIYVEAVVVNAGPEQDQELASFFSRTDPSGQPIEAIHPLTRTSFKTQVVTPRDHIAVFEVGGRQVFVPLLAFNTFYRRGSSEAQTSVAYLVGRDNKGDGGKMAPFRLDQGNRIFRTLGTRQLPNGVRR
jgi:hypothetical protein